MIEVEQQVMAVFDEDGDNVQHGDCLRAAMASIFELPLEDVPHFVESDNWWNEWQDWLAARGLRIGSAFYSVDEDDPAKLNGWPGDVYWLATVKSPRGLARCSVCKGRGKHRNNKPCRYCESTGLVPSLHSIVMFGREVAWDPHPQREMGHLGFVGGYEFRAIDPARLSVDALPERPERIEEPWPEDLERVLRDPEIAIPFDRKVHELLRAYARREPEARITREMYLHLWALLDLETRAA